MTTPNFKKGQWLICRWKKKHGGHTELCRFSRTLREEKFIHDRFISTDEFYMSSVDYVDDYVSELLSLQWRPATKAELKKYSSLIFR